MKKYMKLKQLIIVGVVIVLGFAYYQFVWIKTTKTKEMYSLDKIEDQLLQAQTKAQKMKAMKKVIEERKDDTTNIIGRYNNLENEILVLNEVLKNAVKYYIDFEDAKVNGEYVQRNASITFQTKNYNQAKHIIELFNNFTYTCTINNIQMIAEEDTGGLQHTNVVKVKLDVTFYEWVSDLSEVKDLDTYGYDSITDEE